MFMIKKLLSPILYYSGIYRKQWQRAAESSNLLLVLTYHRIVETEADNVGLFGVERGIPVSVFEAHLRFLLKHFSPVHPDGINDFIQSGTGNIGFLITFDDGYEDNYSLAAPVLEKYGLSAVFFVCSDFLDVPDPFWWEKVSYIIKNTRKSQLTLPSPLDSDNSSVDVGTEHQKIDTYERLCALIKQLPQTQVAGVIDQLATQAAVDLADCQRTLPLISKIQLCDLVQRGFVVGGHTATHANLSLITEEESDKEIAKALDQLEGIISRPVTLFAYPYGNKNEKIRDELESRGMAGIFTRDKYIHRRGQSGREIPRFTLQKPWFFACAYSFHKVLVQTLSAGKK
jgi:peptidoglycan/xylan/chitin deacetylase (PgdA/CDA1 family)